MKLIKFFATAALVASTSLVSGGNAESGATGDYIAACQDWPFCRDIELKDESSEQNFYMAACQDWPFCRDIEVTEGGLPQQLNTVTVRKAV